VAERRADLDALLATAVDRRAWQPDDTKSGARFERMTIGGDRYVLKYQDPEDDWILRATGDPGVRYVRLWEEGILDRLPAVIDAAVVAASFDGAVGRVLLRDVTDALLPTGQPFSMALHNRFIDHMAALHAEFWGWEDEIGLTPLATRYRAFTPVVAAAEAARGSDLLVPRVMAEGWSQLGSVSPILADCVLPLLDDVCPLVSALEALPHTLVHGDWKAANLGAKGDGRTVLLDFGEFPGQASPLADLSWYLALNSDLLPESKDDTIPRYRAALERAGITTTGWWERAVALELLGAMVQFGWEKVLSGPGPELTWWEEHAASGAACL
jgi:hypothetical protein